MPGEGGGTNLGPILQVILAAAGAADWESVLDPWGILGLQGRPRDQATEQVITRLRNARNPAARLWSVELTHGLLDFDIVISTGGSGRTLLDAWFSQFVANMVAQGVSKLRAQEIGIHAMSRDAQGGAPLEPELRQPLASGLTFNGPSSVAQLFIKGVDFWNKQGFVGQQLINHAENYTLNHATITELEAITIGQPAPGDPGVPVVPIGPGVCQPGYNYDPKTELCWPGAPPPPPQPPPPPPPPGHQCPPGFHWDDTLGMCVPDTNPTQDPDPDELTDFAFQALTSLNAITALLQTQAGQSECCTNIVAGIAGITSALTAILAALPSGGGPPPTPIDLTPLVDAVNSVAQAVQAIQPGNNTINVDLTETNTKLQAIADAITTGEGGEKPPPDEYPDLDAKLNGLLDTAAKSGAIDADAVQIIEL